MTAAAPERLIVISDLHLGGRYCRREELLAFLERLPAGPDLVLNGDLLDRFARFEPLDLRLLDLLRAESRRRRVLWLLGNHDRPARFGDLAGIEIAHRLLLPGRALIEHGNRHDRLLRLAGPPVGLLRAALRRRAHRAGATPAVRLGRGVGLWLRGVVRRVVVRGAVAAARRAGAPCVICGHVHLAEDSRFGDIRYVNTGSWVGPPARVARVDGGRVALEPAFAEGA